VSVPLLAPGSVVDGYEIVALLGRGGMGAVYRARRPGAFRTFGPVAPVEVALKTLVGEADEELLQRFRREAELLASLRHPSIVPIHAAGEAHGLFYFAMALVEGESLEEKIRREGPLKPETAVAILRQAADAVAYAHEHKIIHRDLKPANILLDKESGHVLVSDFGLGLKLGDERERLTRTGEILGSPNYMSPEQALGLSKEVNELSDVYGLGTILYTALAGRPPFQGKSALEILRLVCQREPDPIPEAPAALGEFVFRALAKRAADRPPSAWEFARELEEALRARPLLPRGLLWGVFGAAVVCVVATSFFVARALEKRRAGARDSGAASPAPVTSAAPLRANPPSLAERLASSLERQKWIANESLVELKKALARPLPESERAPLLAVSGRLFELAVASNEETKLEQLTLLPLPEKADTRAALGRAWLGIAKRRSARFDRTRVEDAFVSRGVPGSDTSVYRSVVREKIAPTLAAFAWARAADPALPFFPKGLERFFGCVRIFGGRCACTPPYRDDWRAAFKGLDDHPTYLFLLARTEVEDQGTVHAEEAVHLAGEACPVLAKLEGPCPRELANDFVFDVLRKTFEGRTSGALDTLRRFAPLANEDACREFLSAAEAVTRDQDDPDAVSRYSRLVNDRIYPTHDDRRLDGEDMHADEN
jgi:serine/threonine-protein kinase